MYVGLSVLVQQIKREERCDVFTAVRKLRAQRQAMVQHLVSLSSEYRHFSLPFSLTATVRVPVQSYLRLRGSLQEQGRGLRLLRPCRSRHQQRDDQGNLSRSIDLVLTHFTSVSQVNPVNKITEIKQLRAVLPPSWLQWDHLLQVLRLRPEQLIQGGRGGGGDSAYLRELREQDHGQLLPQRGGHSGRHPPRISGG